MTPNHVAQVVFVDSIIANDALYCKNSPWIKIEPLCVSARKWTFRHQLSSHAFVRQGNCSAAHYRTFQLGTFRSGFVHIWITHLLSVLIFFHLSACTVDHCAAGLKRVPVIRTEAKFHIFLLKRVRIAAVVGCLKIRQDFNQRVLFGCSFTRGQPQLSHMYHVSHAWEAHVVQTNSKLVCLQESQRWHDRSTLAPFVCYWLSLLVYHGGTHHWPWTRWSLTSVIECYATHQCGNTINFLLNDC